MKAIIYKSELDFMARCVNDYPNIETGGDIFGFWTHSGYPSVQYIIGPGPEATRHTTAFYQDKNYLVEMGKHLREQYGLQHIGEWHSHHQLNLAEPSGGDKSTVRRAIQTYNLNYFFLVICNIVPQTIKINGFHFSARKTDLDPVKWVVLEGQSPMRKEFDEKFSKLIYRPDSAPVNYAALPVTTLDSVVIVNEGQSAQFPENSWMTQQAGRDQLKTIVETLKKEYRDVRIFQTDDRRVKLEVQAKDKQFSVIFPHEFPKQKPEIDFSQKKEGALIYNFFNELSGRLKWTEDKYKSYITNYITALYSIDEITGNNH